ncbi:MAG: hypothetical protein U0893_27360 [Chloroflexota bacterium]
MEDDPNPNAPTARQAAILRPPHARHRAERVSARSFPHGDVNTVAMPWVDFAEDLRLIRAGECVRDGNRFVVNGREYVMEGNGRLFPTSGDGFIQLTRKAYLALGWYNQFGVTSTVEARIVLERVTEDERRQARLIWQIVQEWRRRQG